MSWSAEMLLESHEDQDGPLLMSSAHGSGNYSSDQHSIIPGDSLRNALASACSQRAPEDMPGVRRVKHGTLVVEMTRLRPFWLCLPNLLASYVCVMNPCRICNAPWSFDEEGASSTILLIGATGTVHGGVLHLMDVMKHLTHHHVSELHLDVLQVYKPQERATKISAILLGRVVIRTQKITPRLPALEA